MAYAGPPFHQPTDVATSSSGEIFVSDGYRNARILEYTPEGKKIREWGSAGTGPGQFTLPHSIQIDENGIIYVADRENGRIQRFSLEGRYIGEWGELGKTFSLKITPAGDFWMGTQPRNVPNGSEGWIVKVDRRTGKVRPSRFHLAMVVPLLSRKKQAEFSARDSIRDCQ